MSRIELVHLYGAPGRTECGKYETTRSRSEPIPRTNDHREVTCGTCKRTASYKEMVARSRETVVREPKRVIPAHELVPIWVAMLVDRISEQPGFGEAAHRHWITLDIDHWNWSWGQRNLFIHRDTLDEPRIRWHYVFQASDGPRVEYKWDGEVDLDTLWALAWAAGWVPTKNPPDSISF